MTSYHISDESATESEDCEDLDVPPSKPAILKKSRSPCHFGKPVVADTDAGDKLDASQTSSDSDTVQENLTAKRKRQTAEPHQLQWSDDDSQNQGEMIYQKIKNKKSDARKKALKSAKRARAVEAKNRPQDDAVAEQRNASEAGFDRKKKAEYGEGSADEDLMEDTLPEYLQERRRRFDERVEKLKQGGLVLPPSYDEVEFSDDDQLENLKERPNFTMLKACAPYKDIQLPYSLGIIPAAIATWLRDYQVKGAQFLHQLFVYQKGGILGDDMGLGKTIQIIAFLTAAYGKTGDERDRKRMRKMRKAGSKYPRTLIICPGSLMNNWRDELRHWGWWHAEIYHAVHKEEVLASAQSGHLEIMITTYDTYRANKEEINMVPWDCVVADEFHKIKERNTDITRSMKEINALCRIGLTGTAIQNKYEELWTLLDWTNPGRFGPMATWKVSICEPLKLGQSHTATNSQLARARMTAKKLVDNLLPQFFLRRMKTLISDQLPKKSDRVVFCPLTEVQAVAYENFLESEVVQAIKNSSELCGCGKGKRAGWCCNTLLSDGTKWQSWVFPAIFNLQKLSNHLAQLIPQSTDTMERQQKDYKLLEIALPDRCKQLYDTRDNIANFMNPEFCGKWKVLRKLLKFWHDEVDANNKVLIFSHSVRLLKMLQNLFVHTSYNVKYLDGSLKYDERSDVVNDFNTDPSQFVFLISTKAGGVGLNITSANKVVIFDPNWNPSYDLQAQDRAYRIGQLRDVEVFRLVSQGTLEEIVYARQIYKQQQASIGYNASSERRYFQGVQGRPDQKGEIFGLQNLFSFQNEHVLLKDIVNKTNIAESRADVRVASLELEAEDTDIEDDPDSANFKAKEDAAISQLVADITGDNTQPGRKVKGTAAAAATTNRHDPVMAILASVGVEYTHENSEVIGSSKVEARLSKRAEQAAAGERWGTQDKEARVFFEDASQTEFSMATGVHYEFRPPEEVKKRQFCSMAKWARYEDVVDFALHVEGLTQAERRDFLGKFYRARMEVLMGKVGAEEKMKKCKDGEDKFVLDVPLKAVELKSDSDDETDEL